VQPDRVNHHIVEPRPINHASLTPGALTKADGSAVLPVAQHEDHLARSIGSAESAERVVEGTPEWRGRVRQNPRGQRGQELVGVARERRADLDVLSECTHASHVVGKQS
jgi:hypothetical protein